MRYGKIYVSIVAAMFMICGIAYGAKKEGDVPVIAQGKKVSFNYTLTVDGEKIDSSEAQGPLVYTHGVGQIIKGLETALEGLKVGDTKKVSVAAKDGYGEVNPAAFKEVEKTKLPQEIAPSVGDVLTVTTPEGASFPVIIREVKEQTVIIDMNHPLAGKQLNFDVSIVAIE